MKLVTSQQVASTGCHGYCKSKSGVDSPGLRLPDFCRSCRTGSHHPIAERDTVNRQYAQVRGWRLERLVPRELSLHLVSVPYPMCMIPTVKLVKL